MTDTALGLSDKEFLDKNPAEFLDFSESEDVEKSEDTVVEEETNTSDQTDDSTEESSEAQEQTEVAPEEKEVSQPKGDTPPEREPFTDSDTTESLDTSKKDSTETKEDTPETTEFDYESAFKKISAPFKANGMDMQVEDPNDIVRLMQMGANYQKKMAQLKPNLKLIKMLENNELLDEAKLNNLIDLSKKDPQAITKLIKESNVDPLEIDKEAPVDYQPNNYAITEKEYNLDRILDEIKGSETFNRTINVLSKDWDVESRSTISDYPEIISVINDHMANGVFDQVNARLQQEKALGKLAGTPDVEAYRLIAEDMHKNDSFKNLQPESIEPSKVSSKTDEKADADRNKQRKAVAPVKQTTTKKASPDNEFLGLSDDEFMKKYAVR
jgi:hypothetical protein